MASGHAAGEVPRSVHSMAKILIADDNPTVRMALRHLLQGRERWEVHETADGEKAVAQALVLHPDVVVLDLAMPNMDGLHAARKISAALPRVPIVLYTMHASRQLEVEAGKFGVRRIVSKSEGGTLPNVIRELLADSSETKASSPVAPEVAAVPAAGAVTVMRTEAATPEAVPAKDKPERRCG